MADEKRSSGPPGGKRRRPLTTIDLKATEIASDPVKPTEPSDAPQERPQADARFAAASAAEEPKVEPRDPSPPPRRKPRAGGWRPEWLDVAAVRERISALRAQMAERLNVRLIAAGTVSAVAMLVLFLSLWIFGTVSNRDDLTVTLAARFALLEMQVRDLAAKPLNIHVDYVGKSIEVFIPDMFGNLGATQHLAGVPRKVVQERIFFGCEVNIPSCSLHSTHAFVNCQVGDSNYLASESGATSE